MEKKTEVKISGEQAVCGTEKAQAKKKWQKPKLEDVSGKVMAQPYIRFT
jgi:hypothetical protein